MTSIRTGNVWSSPREIVGNPVRQLPLPVGELVLGWWRRDRRGCLVPTAALRSKLAAKFETLGVLQRLRIVAAGAPRPSVGRLSPS